MKLGCFQVVFPVAFRAEVLGVLIALLPMAVFTASTMNSGRFSNEESSIEFAAPVATATSETWLGRSFSGSQDSFAENQERVPETNSNTAEPSFPRAVEASITDEVDQYLWAAYERSPTKQDSTGDFTWKDAAAAAHLGMSLKTYVIGGMDPDLRELLYHAGLAMDAARLHWTILSAFRDDYRQSLASGLKAHTNNSLHGGSAATGGYGHGCAVDIKDADGNSDIVWHWLDKNSAQIGLQRLLPRADPAHVQPRGAWHRLAVALRNNRLGSDAATRETPINTPTGSTAHPSETEVACVSLRHWDGDSPQAKSPTGLSLTKAAAAQFAKVTSERSRR
jgi:hypothetical protein